ncbi:hypothetical protein BDZ91DRAFT_507755 [Kalaharituber pfeilii]|nr:hypothetical protein BDZ91DRAFT_507755 [Kalaharituber pfeilii]
MLESEILEISKGPIKYKVHRAVLASLGGDFVEPNDIMFVLQNNFGDPYVLGLFLQWAYTKEYHVDLSKLSISKGVLHVHKELYRVAYFYGVHDLQDLCLRKVDAWLQKHGETPPEPVAEEVLAVTEVVIKWFPELEDAIVDCLLRYISWTLKTMRRLKGFNDLIERRPKVGVFLLQNCRPAENRS